MDIKTKLQEMLKEAQDTLDKPYQEEDEHAMNLGKVIALEDALRLFNE